MFALVVIKVKKTAEIRVAIDSMIIVVDYIITCDESKFIMTSAVTIIEIDIEIAIFHGDRMGSRSRSLLLDLRRFSRMTAKFISSIRRAMHATFVGTEAH